VSAAAVCRVLAAWQVVDPAEVVVVDAAGSPAYAWCGGAFAAQPGAKYCGAACRMAACRSRR